jgi:hypothetical protein
VTDVLDTSRNNSNPVTVLRVAKLLKILHTNLIAGFMVGFGAYSNKGVAAIAVGGSSTKLVAPR